MRRWRRFAGEFWGVMLALLLAGAGRANAAPITWSAAQGISGDSDVVTTGSLVGAFNVGIAGVGSTTVNGVPFAAFALSGTSATSGNFTFSSPTPMNGNNNVGSGSPPFSNLSAPYQTLLSSAAGSVNTLPFTLTMSGLKLGDTYEFEWWFNTSNGFVGPTTATAGNSVTLDSNPSGQVGGLGQFATGIFTADATSEVITFSSTLQGALNGFELRDVSAAAVPEPSSLTLLGLGVGGFALCRRLRKRPAV